MPISPPANPRLGQVYQEAGTTYVWLGSTWVETIPSTSAPFPAAIDIGSFAIGPTGPAGTFGATGPSGGPIGPTGYTGHTGPLPNFSVEFGPDNGLMGTINYDVNAGVNDTSLGGMWTTNNSTNFMNAFGRLSIGDTYTAKLDYPNGNSTIKSLTLASVPVGTSSYWQWSTYENDHDLIGDYGLIYLNSLQGKPGPIGATGPVGVGLATGGNSFISSNLIPATSNVYSIGDSTHWWKDMWLSAHTLYVGGIPITTEGGQLSIPSLNVTNGISTPSNNITGFNFSQRSDIAGNSSRPWITPGVGNVYVYDKNWPGITNWAQKSFNDVKKNYLAVSDYDSSGANVYSKFTNFYNNNDGNTYIIMTSTTNTSQYGVWWIEYISRGLNYDSIYQPDFSMWTIQYLTGTVDSSTWLGNINPINFQLTDSSIDGRRPFNTAQKISWDIKSGMGNISFNMSDSPISIGSNMIVSPLLYVPLVSTNLKLSCPNYSDPGLYIFPNSPSYDGQTINVELTFADMNKDKFINVDTTGFGNNQRIPGRSKFALTYSDSNKKWAVSNFKDDLGNSLDGAEPVMSFDCLLCGNNTSGYTSNVNGRIVILDSTWPVPGTLPLGYSEYYARRRLIKLNLKDKNGVNINDALNVYFTRENTQANTYMIIEDASDSSKYVIFFINQAIPDFQWTHNFNFFADYVTGTVASSDWNVASKAVKVTFTGPSIQGKWPLSNTQKLYLTGINKPGNPNPNTDGNAVDMTFSINYGEYYPLASKTLEIHVPATYSPGNIIMPNSNAYDGYTLNVVIKDNSIPAANFKNMNTSSLISKAGSTVPSGTFFTTTFLASQNQWIVTSSTSI